VYTSVPVSNRAPKAHKVTISRMTRYFLSVDYWRGLINRGHPQGDEVEDFVD